MPKVATCIWSFYCTQLFLLSVFPYGVETSSKAFSATRPSQTHPRLICIFPLHLIRPPLQFRLARVSSRVLTSPNPPRFVIYRRSKLLHQQKKSPYKPPSAVCRRWTLSLSDGISDTLLKITTRHTINFHEYMKPAIWQHPGRRNRRKKWKRCDGTGRQDRICGYVDRLRMPSLPLLLPRWSVRTGRPEGARWLQPEDVSHFLLRSNTQTVTPTLVVPNTLYTSDLSAATTARCLLLPPALLNAPFGLVPRTRKKELQGAGPGAAKSRSSSKPSFFPSSIFLLCQKDETFTGSTCPDM